MARLPRTLVVLAGLAALVAAGCDAPRDPHHTLARVQAAGTLRVGISANAPWTPIELKLIAAVAAGLGVRPVFIEGAESALVARLERRELDLVAGGLETSTPWKRTVGITRPYPGGAGRRVMATPPGENAFLLKVDQLLDAQGRP